MVINEIIIEEMEEYCHNCENIEDFKEENLVKNCKHPFCSGQTENLQCSVYTNKTVKKTLILIKH